MKKIIITCCVVAVLGVNGYAQTTKKTNVVASSDKQQSRVELIAENTKSIAKLLGESKIDEASELYKDIVVELLDELGAAEQRLISTKEGKEREKLEGSLKKQVGRYGEIFALRNDLITGREKLVDLLNQFIVVATAE